MQKIVLAMLVAFSLSVIAGCGQKQAATGKAPAAPAAAPAPAK